MPHPRAEAVGVLHGCNGAPALACTGAGRLPIETQPDDPTTLPRRTMRILVIDDEQDQAMLSRGILEKDGFQVDVAMTGGEGVALASSNDYDGIVLDVMLPDMTGFEVAKTIRARGRMTPILMLTGRSDSEDVVTGLDSGADDYLAKPFDVEVFRARCRALVRRSIFNSLRAGNLEMDRSTRRAIVEGRSVRLTPREARLLEVLMLAAGEVVTKDVLLQQVWEMDFDPMTNVVNVHITRLRAKLRKIGCTTEILTLPGVGFQLG
jgi:DNA-binding response OmpR family regulator